MNMNVNMNTNGRRSYEEEATIFDEKILQAVESQVFSQLIVELKCTSLYEKFYESLAF